jgi:hypothetical protein
MLILFAYTPCNVGGIVSDEFIASIFRVVSSETLINTSNTSRCISSEEQHLNFHCRKNLKCYLHSIFLTSIVALYSHVCLHVPPPHLILPSLQHPSNNWLREQIKKLLIMQFSPTSCYFLSLRTKYSPQCLLLKHPQSIRLLRLSRRSNSKSRSSGVRHCVMLR